MHRKVLRLIANKPKISGSICIVCLLFIMLSSLPVQTFAAFNRFTVLGRPTITVARINAILCHNGSPACGTGRAMYRLGIKYGINPLVALAFFKQESAFGRFGIAPLTHSLGNIRCTSGYRCIGGFRAYHTWVQGYQDWYSLIRNLYINIWHLTTIQQIIPIYAPSTENNTALYIHNVEEFMKNS